MKPQKFTTLDLYLSAFLESHGIKAELENLNGRVVFSFPANDELYKLANAFNSNVPVPIADYISTFKTLKARMFSAKGAL
jgi:hypothetical protein